jgi:3-hydroxyacyl-CoA dehydrogenase
MSMTIDFDQCKPELHLAEHAHSQHIRAEQHDQRGEYRYPLRKGGKPVADIDANGSQFGHAGDDPGEPVGPAGNKTSERTDEFVGIRHERACDRAIQEQFTQGPHNKENHQSADGVSQYEARTRVLDGLGGT